MFRASYEGFKGKDIPEEETAHTDLLGHDLDLVRRLHQQVRAASLAERRASGTSREESHDSCPLGRQSCKEQPSPTLSSSLALSLKKRRISSPAVKLEEHMKP